MKKIMSVLTLVVFLASAVAMVSFTVAEHKSQSTAWYYVNPDGTPRTSDGQQNPDLLDCEDHETIVCAREFNLDASSQPTTPTPMTPRFGIKN